jgi:hypothetical protein
MAQSKQHQCPSLPSGQTRGDKEQPHSPEDPLELYLLKVHPELATK